MSLGSLAGSVSRRRGDLHIAAAPASAVGFWARFGGFSDLQGAILLNAPLLTRSLRAHSNTESDRDPAGDRPNDESPDRGPRAWQSGRCSWRRSWAETRLPPRSC